MNEFKSLCYICNDIRPVNIVYDKNSICILRCSNCGTFFRPREEHVIINPVNNTSEYYAESIRCVVGNRLFFRLTFENLIKRFPHIKNGNFLDFGCGIGNSLIEAQRLGFYVHAIDSSKWVINYCKQIGFEVFPSLEEIKQKQIRFDIINLNHVLEHISEPLAFMCMIKDFLKEDGIIRIEVPNCSKLFFWKLFTGVKYIVAKPSVDHIYYYTIKTLSNIISKSGLEIIDIHSEGFGNYIRHKATMLNPNILIRISSAFLYLTNIEKVLNLESFLVAVVKKK